MDRASAPILLLLPAALLALQPLDREAIESRTRGADQRALKPCFLAGLERPAACGRLVVPLRPDQPAGKTLELRLAVVPARTRRPASEPLFVLAGGPGQAATEYGSYLDAAFSRVMRQRDLVLVDQRGTGGSSPLDCSGSEDSLLDLGEDPGKASGLPIDPAVCLAHLEGQGLDPRWFTNREAAADLEAVRRYLGYARIHLWGGSYGTRTALWYALLYPERVASVVLDGAAPFAVRFPLYTAREAERALDLLLRECEDSAACRAAFPELRARLDGLLAELAAAEPRGGRSVIVSHPRTGAPLLVRLTPALVASTIRGALYSREYRTRLPLLIDRAARGDFGPLLAQLDETAGWSTDTMSLGMTLAVVCSEDVARIGDASGEESEARSLAAGSFLGTVMVDAWREGCAGWPRNEALFDEALLTRAVEVPALILSGGLDPVTPPEWGSAMARHFPRSLAVTVEAAAHNVSHLGCVPELIDRFLSAGLGEVDPACVASLKRLPLVTSGLGPSP